jgi:glycosyltransferase involved in cell wall biosynthesis
VTIPNEWEKIADVNIGYTAGIETTKVAPLWIQKANEVVDKVIVVSNHSKDVFEKTQIMAVDNAGKHFEYPLTTPVDVVNYPVKNYDDLPELNLDLKTDFNFLSVAQFGPNRKCKIYLLHGDMTDEEMHSLYVHSKVSALVTFTHGEGYGLPPFEAAYSGLPVVSTGWSGQLDFLVDEKRKDRFYNVAFDLQPVQKDVVWKDVLIEESMWAYPRSQSAKEKMRECYDDINENKEGTHASLSCQYASELKNRFSKEKMYAEFVNCLGVEKELEAIRNEVDALLGDLL